MKTKIISLLVFSFILSCCSKDDSELPDQNDLIIGEWQLFQVGYLESDGSLDGYKNECIQQSTMAFSNKGVVIHKFWYFDYSDSICYDNSNYYDNYKGTWGKKSESNYFIFFKNDKGDRITSIISRILFPNPNTMQIINDTESGYSYVEEYHRLE